MVASARFPRHASAELVGTGGTLRQVAIKAGHVAGRHHHEFEQLIYVVSGAGRLECEQGGIPFEPGTSLHLPAVAWHSVEFAADAVRIDFNLANGG